MKFHTPYKALICDVDGTLVPNRPDGMPSEEIKYAINKIKQYIHVGIATSRNYSRAKRIFDELDLNGPSIICGGAMVIDAQTRETLLEKTISQKDFYTITSIFRAYHLPFSFTDSGTEYVGAEKMYTPHRVTDIFTEDATREQADKIIQKLVDVSTIYGHKNASWKEGKLCLGFSHAEASKQDGILEVARLLRITPNEIIGVGDGYNDFSLLMACGLKVAMGNAVDDIKAIADYIAPSVENNGVADVIQQFIYPFLTLPLPLVS